MTELASPKKDFTEGSLVRSPTDMYRDYGVGRILKIRGEQAKCGPCSRTPVR